MPPGRWKFWFYVAAVFAQATLAAQQMQEAISMSSDGWRPIVGNRRHPESDNTQLSSTHRVYDSETTLSPYNQKPHTTTSYHKNGRKPSIGTKTKYQSQKGPSQYFVPTGASQTYKKSPQAKKPVIMQSKPKKPVRGQMVAHSTRSEVYVPPPGHAGGSYYFKTLPQSNLKTREAQGFAFANNFGITQQAAHLELARFPVVGGDNILQRPTYFVAKPLQNDEFTRNLVPPPNRARNPQKGNNKGQDTKISLYAFKEGPATDASSNVPQFGARPNQYLPQVSPTFDYTTQQQKPQKVKEQALDVQVTKENLKQYSHNVAPSAFGIVPGRNSYPIGYVDYDFPKARPSSAPSTLTYEVTEGKWLDTPSQQYQFRPQDAFLQFQSQRQPSANARPGLLFQSTAGPPVFQSPIVDLSVSPFLPTPYKPENVVLPTSPTQDEAATVFTKVSNKMNKYRNDALKESPLFFDIKEVSTHYPILGNPEPQSEGNTDSPLPLQETGEISNEISTTQKEVKDNRTRRPIHKQPPPTQPTQATSTRDPTRSRITNRRRPRPKRPLTTTTTTEEPMVIQTYESMRSQEVMEEEKPRRRRPRPQVQEEEEAKPIEEENFSRQRISGRYSLRNRERTTERIEMDTVQRKRLRPGYKGYEESTEPSSDQQYSQETSIQSEEFQRYQPEVTPAQPIRPETRPFIEEVTTTERVRYLATTEPEQDVNTRFHLPENEVDYTTQPQQDLVMTTVPTTTTEVPSTVRSTRLRRPSKFDSSNRPRFSVKEYRQRLQTSTTPSTTTRQPQENNNVRLRFPNRLRARPTTASSRIDEDITDEITTTIRSRFSPKQPRHEQMTTTTENSGIITEKAIKAVNTRLRPFGRTKQPTETTTSATKISIRPNLFSARRRSGYPSLKERIQQKLRKNETQPDEIKDDDDDDVAESATTELILPTTTEEMVENAEQVENTMEEEDTSNDISTEISVEESNVTEDVLKSDDYSLSQRVSDLTSSFKDYDKPGAFNAVAPTSRSIPNHFTLSTDDPILPIEAFFPGLKEKKERR